MRIAALVVLLTAMAAYQGLHLSALSGTESWLHLRTGAWILQNHGVPHYGVFSQYPDLPWRAPSWLFDLLLAAGYQAMGLRALPILEMALSIALAWALFWSARGRRQSFWVAALLAGVALCALPALQLQPVICSVLLYALELGLLFRALSRADGRTLYWLPLLFAVWANLDSRFIYGLLTLILLLVISVVESGIRRYREQWFAQQAESLPILTGAGVVAACFAATLLNPYGYHAYDAALANFASSPLQPYLPELSAIGFRRPQEFTLLLLAMAGFFSVGRWRTRGLFRFSLMLLTALLSFPAQRNSWLVAVASVAVIADAIPIQAGEAERERHWKRNVVTAMLVLVVLAAVISRMPANRDALLARVAQSLPVRACDYIRDNHLAPPLFNPYEWGGFLTWYLPEYPVVIDARNELYGDDINLRYFRLTHAEIPLSGDLSFVDARTILLPRHSPMAVALSAVPQFRVLYSDDVAVVLSRQPQ